MSTWLEGIWKESVFAARRLVKAPAFTITAVITLALAIAANVSLFAVIERVILNPLPYPDSGRLVELDHGAELLNATSGFGLTSGVYFHYSERSGAIESIAIHRAEDATSAETVSRSGSRSVGRRPRWRRSCGYPRCWAAGSAPVTTRLERRPWLFCPPASGIAATPPIRPFLDG